MAFPIIPKRRSGAPGNPASLQLGELAVNTADGELYLGGDGGVMLLNGPVAAGTTVTEHTGDGTTVAFTFGGYNGTADGGYIVSVGGIDQPPSKYSISSTAGGTITFVEAPVDGELISIRAIVAGSGGGGGSGTVTSITAGTGLDGGTITDSGTISLASITTAQINVGSSTQIPVLSIDAQGRVTSLTTQKIAPAYTANLLIVAGGGGGTGGGGGAGGMIETVMPLVFGSTYSIVVGAGGAGTVYPTPGTVGANGTYSAFATVTAIGGGGAGRWGAATAGNLVGQNGGSGGGAGANTSIGASSNGGSGTQGQGNNGGATPGISSSPAGGGGGAGAVGAPGTTNLGGNGGVGLQSSITGSATYYAGGGGGSSGSSQGTGGLGGGGNGAATTGFAGAANTGGGGGGATGSPATGGNGGSGVVIMSVPTSQYSGITTGSPTVTTSGSNTILTYTSSGTYAA